MSREVTHRPDPSIIKPEVNRHVLLYLNRADFYNANPTAAIIVGVYPHQPRVVDVAAFINTRAQFAFSRFERVTLLQPGDDIEANVPPSPAAFCTWMPYQLGQAGKTEDVAKVIGNRIDALEKRFAGLDAELGVLKRRREDGPAAEAFLRQPVRYFAGLMEQKLRRHDARRGNRGWMGCSIGSLIAMLADHVARLEARYADGDATLADCADVGNFAMMIADRVAAIQCSYTLETPLPGAPADEQKPEPQAQAQDREPAAVSGPDPLRGTEDGRTAAGFDSKRREERHHYRPGQDAG